MDGIWDLIESVSEGFLTYSYNNVCKSIEQNTFAEMYLFLQMQVLKDLETSLESLEEANFRPMGVGDELSPKVGKGQSLEKGGVTISEGRNMKPLQIRDLKVSDAG